MSSFPPRTILAETASYVLSSRLFFADLNHVPSGLPSDIVKMDLSGNSIRHLKPQQFLMSKDLKLLNLSSNSLQQIETGQKFTYIGNKAGGGAGYDMSPHRVSPRWRVGSGSFHPIQADVFRTGREILSGSFILLQMMLSLSLMSK